VANRVILTFPPVAALSRSDSRCSPPCPCSVLSPPARSDPPLDSSGRFLYLGAFGYRRLERDVMLVVRMVFHPPVCLASSLDLVFTVWCASLGLQAASWAAPQITKDGHLGPRKAASTAL